MRVFLSQVTAVAEIQHLDDLDCDIYGFFAGPDIRASRIILLAFHNAAFEKVGTLASEQTLATRACSFVHHDVPSHHSL